MHDVPSIRRKLLRWYDRNGRQMPWRVRGGLGNPYHVLVSEAMLQQTQVATVRDYFLRFITAFPTLADLAAAGEQSVLRLWQGLGYYRRARHLHQAARTIVADHGGVIPGDVKTLLTLPGIGPYTAGAIASIAFGIRTPILDGNVARVLARCFGIEEPVDAPATRKQLWALAEELTSPTRPGDFNQAMMDLGATICTPRRPQCDACPIAAQCVARATDRAEMLPVMLPRRAPKVVTHRIVAIERRGRFLFQQRPATGLWANLWQLPTMEDANGALNEWIEHTTGLAIDDAARIDAFRHQTTHRTIAFELWYANPCRGRLKPNAGIWRPLAALTDLPLGKPQIKAVELLQAQTAARRQPPHRRPTSASRN